MEASGQVPRTDPTSPPLLPATVREVQRLSPRVLGLVISAPTDFSWRPGQHVAVSGQPRGGSIAYYSIASAFHTERPGEFELAVVEDSLSLGEVRPGAPIFVGPASGAFPYARLVASSHVVLVGMGTGVAPLRAAVQALAGERRVGTAPKIILIQGARSQGECLYHQEFLASRGGDFDYRPVLSQPGPEYAGRRGRVQQHLSDLPIEGTEYCVCGSEGMVAEVRSLLLGRGVMPAAIYGEGYS